MNEIVESGHNRFLIPRSDLNVGPVMNPPALMRDKANSQETSLDWFEKDSDIEVYEVSRVNLQHTSIVRRTRVNFINVQSLVGTTHPFGVPSGIFPDKTQKGTRDNHAQPVIDRYRAVMDVSKRVLPGKIIDLVL